MAEIPKSLMQCGVLLLVLFVISVSPARAQTDPCDGDDAIELPAGSGEDLAVTGECLIVKAGTYHYNNVNIYDGGILKFEDAAIDFWAQSILVENEGSLLAGSPEAPIGTAGGVVTIHLYGADQGARPFGTDQGPRGMGITCKSDDFCGVPSTIWNANYDSNTDQLKPKNEHVKSALPGGEDYFYRYDPMPYDDGNPNAYFGYKVLGVSYGGTLKLFGKKGATYGDVDAAKSGNSWVRLDKTLLPGQDTLVLDRSVDWAKDDHIVVTTTDYLPGHSEEFIIDTVSADKKTITVTKTAEYIHNGEVFPLDSVPDRLGLDIRVNGQPAAETRAAVALLTRSIRIVSAGDDFGDPFPEPDVLVDSKEKPGTQHPYYFGGHTVIRQGVKAAQIQGVEFKQMGQGGRMGHYPIHFHLTRKAPPNTFVKDSSINESMTRWVVLHGAQNITLARNVGYKSIGHGFYLEDGTEINNKLYSNIGIFARAAVDNAQNPRQVPGILASAENPGIEQVPYHSDFQHPSVFWIMNGWNDFEYNMAAGATACGVCYWLVPGANSGLSLQQQWDSYASLQTKFSNAGTTPLKKFEGNFCTSAMNSFNTVGNSAQCHGVGGVTGDVVLDLVPNPLVPRHQTPPTEAARAAKYYPKVADAGSRIATNCYYNSENDKAVGAFLDDNGDLICSEVARCSGDNADTNCKVTVLDRYTTAFHWAQHNFSAIWLRPLWSLVQNSVISDVQNAGLTFVTGGDYTKASSPEGNWLLARKNVFIGHTQDDNPYASDAGPFNPQGLECDSRCYNGQLLHL
ncbi:MAG: G8 domain-containing protein [Gammaproteobacteria bacterium]